jgi:hypothetical protein
MFKWSMIPIIILSICILSSCNEVSSPSENNDSSEGVDWLIPENQIFDGGPGKDGIPALNNPGFVSASQAGYLANQDLVVLYKHGDEVRAYPHPILDWHEIINDGTNAEKIAVSYCPLTGSAIGYSQMIDVAVGGSQQTTFGVSGLLYNTNLILYDRLTDSYWSQMKLQCVAGDLKGLEPKLVSIIETTFGTAKTLYPQLKVVSNETGIYNSSQYNVYPYGSYRTNNDRLIFPISTDDSRLPRKQRVLGVLGEVTNRVYQLKDFADDVKVINDELDGRALVIVGSNQLNFMAAYYSIDSQGNEITLSATENNLPNVMQDAKGNIYDIFGKVTSGPNEGMQLEQAKSFIAFWFSFGAFYPGIEIYAE